MLRYYVSWSMVYVFSTKIAGVLHLLYALPHDLSGSKQGEGPESVEEIK